jgi:hypothetical protein
VARLLRPWSGPASYACTPQAVARLPPSLFNAASTDRGKILGRMAARPLGARTAESFISKTQSIGSAARATLDLDAAGLLEIRVDR